MKFLIIIFLVFSINSRADFFGTDVIVLGQILANTMQQLAQLKEILATGQTNLDLLNEINRGINDSLVLFKTISPNSDPGLYREWEKVNDAIRKIEQIYGIVIQSKDAQVQQDTDRSVAEAITMNNSIYEYTKEIDQIGEDIKNYSHAVSPGGAQKLTAQSMGVMLHVLNQSLKAQATGLKLQAQTLAIENRKDKEATKNVVETSDSMRAAMKNENPRFRVPRF